MTNVKEHDGHKVEVILVVVDLHIGEVRVGGLDFLERAVEALVAVSGGFCPGDSFRASRRILLLVGSGGGVRDGGGRALGGRLGAFVEVMFAEDVLAHGVVGGAFGGRRRRSFCVVLAQARVSFLSGLLYSLGFLLVGGQRPGAELVAHEVRARVGGAQHALAHEVVEHGELGAELAAHQLLVPARHTRVADG